MRVSFLIILLCLSSQLSAADLTVTVRSSKGHALPSAIVTVTPLSGQVISNQMAVQPKQGAEMAQQGSMFTPFILPVRKGTKVFFPNKDEFRHHVYSFSKAKTFELKLYSQDEKKSQVFDQVGLVAVGCNIHDNMLAFIYVTDAPLFAKTQDKGTATFKGLPKGKYIVEAWHVDQKKKQQFHKKTVTISDGQIASSLELSLVRGRKNVQKKPNEKGGRY